MLPNDWKEYDREHLWHPYTSMTDPLPTYPVVAASGVRLILENGRTLVDGMSSWWAAIHGYNCPALNAALCGQAEKMSHVMFGGITHPAAVELGAQLIDMTPSPLQKVFLSDSGSVSVEVAIKMALQYWQGQGQPQKNRLLTIRSGYHGDTFGAMAVCDPITGMHELFTDILPQHFFADRPNIKFDEPWNDADIAGFKALLAAHCNEIAAVILEPIVQGAGGMWFYSPEYLSRVRELCDAHDILLICDEIATGFGRTGKLFACEYADISPDIMCLGKALTGGYLSLAATLTTENVALGVSKSKSEVFMHGPTFMGNPLACAVAAASIGLLIESPWQTRVAEIERILKERLAPCANLSGVADVRVLGAIGVVEMETPVEMARVQKQFVEKGVWIRPFGKLIYTMPPFIIEEEDLEMLTTAICDVVASEAQS